jgi:hypothetical protein
LGRRAVENGDSGTDDGAAGVGFLVGTRVAGQMVGEFPGFKSGLDSDGNVSATSDYRGVYSALLEQWLGVAAAARDPDGRLAGVGSFQDRRLQNEARHSRLIPARRPRLPPSFNVATDADLAEVKGAPNVLAVRADGRARPSEVDRPGRPRRSPKVCPVRVVRPTGCSSWRRAGGGGGGGGGG